MNWEYKIISMKTCGKLFEKPIQEWENELNKLTKDGWELVSVIPMQQMLGVYTTEIRCFMKRQIEVQK